MESTVYITKCELRNMNLVECRPSSQNDRTVSIASLFISLCTLASGLAKEAVVSLAFFLGHMLELGSFWTERCTTDALVDSPVSVAAKRTRRLNPALRHRGLHGG